MSEVAERPAPSAKPAAAASPAKLLLCRVAQRELAKAIQSVAGITERHQALPITGNVLIVKSGEVMTFTTTDLDQQLTISTGFGVGDTAAKVTVNARKLMDVLKAMPEEASVSMTLEGDRVIVTGARTRFTLHTLPAEDFPLVVAANYDATVAVPGKDLRGLLDHTAYSMGVTDIRSYINGLLIETSGTTLRAVGSNGHRLATATIALESAGEDRKVILPRKAVLELQRLVAKIDDPVSIHLSLTQASFEFGSARLTTKLLEGGYPDYKRVVPTSTGWSVTFERMMVERSLQRSDVMTNSKFRGCELVFMRDMLTILVTSADGECRDEIGIDYDGKKFSFGVNISYLLEAITNTGGETVTLGFRSPTDSVLITSVDKPGLVGVVMPMRL